MPHQSQVDEPFKNDLALLFCKAHVNGNLSQ
jgi:hypothetical protein